MKAHPLSLPILTTLLFLQLLTPSTSYNFKSIEILKADRQINLNNKYPTQIIKIQYTALESSASVYEHITPQCCNDKIAKICFSKQKSAKEHQCYSYTKQSFLNQDGKMNYVYQVDIKSPLLKGQTTTIYIKTTYINRYKNLPEKITLSEEQKLQYQDFRYFYSPYKVRQQTVLYKFQKLIDYPESGQKTGLSGVTYKTDSPIASFTSQTHIIHGVNNYPQMIYTQVQKIIQISHWGNIAITQFYKLKNTGPQMKGQFSRLQFSPQQPGNNDAKNAFPGTQTTLPYETWGLYYRDQVGNISTSKAYRNNAKRQVEFAIVPRFFLVGGWKSNFEIGYNLDTSKGFLTHDGTHFQTRKLKAIYAFNDILAQKYTIKVILPQGSSNIKMNIGSDFIQPSEITQSLSFSYLDFVGRPAYTIESQVLKTLPSDRIIQIQYDLNDSFGIWRKPILVFAALLSLILVGVVINRIKLEAFDVNVNDQKQKRS